MGLLWGVFGEYLLVASACRRSLRRGMVVPARDGSGFDAARDSRKLEHESEERYKAFLALWERLQLDDLTGFFFWQRQAFDLLHQNFEDTGASCYLCARAVCLRTGCSAPQPARTCQSRR